MIWTERRCDEAVDRLMRDPMLGYDDGEVIHRRPIVDLYGHSIALDGIERSAARPDWIVGVRLRRIGAPSYGWTFRTGTWSERVGIREAVVALSKILVPEDGTFEAPESESKRAKPDAQRVGNDNRDAVDEASWESFPASDPPAFY